jgi:hypothetical protein
MGEGYRRHFGALTYGSEDPFMEAGYAEETTTAPAVNETRALQHGPLVEGNLTLVGPNSAVYVLGTHYLEDLAGGFKNLSIPAGTALTARYFYLDAETGGDAGGGVLAAYAEPVMAGELYDPFILTSQGDIVMTIVKVP